MRHSKVKLVLIQPFKIKEMGHSSKNPLAIESPNAKIQAIDCFDGIDEMFKISIGE